jgi:hypothetical protein
VNTLQALQRVHDAATANQMIAVVAPSSGTRRTEGAMVMTLRYATAFVVVLAAIAKTGAVQEGARPERVPVLVELFTAEGCSSCPPADNLLALMIDKQPAAGAQIIGLGEHVDYWDRLGWKDRFSSAALTKRQQLYADTLKLESIYTPQIVVDGATAVVGSDVQAARGAIERAISQPHGVIALAIQESRAGAVAVDIDVASLPPVTARDRADLIAAIAESGLQTDVKRGENGGKVLAHAAVVRELQVVADVSGATQTARAEIKLKPEWKREALNVVVFVQERGSRRVLASASVPLTKAPVR